MCGVVFITNSIKRKTFKLNFQIGRLLIAIVLLAIVFFGVDYIRSGGKYSIDVAMTQLVGYFPASYNRMAAIVGGNMQYPDANWGYYTFQMLWDTPVVKPITQTIFAVKDSLIPATSYNNWVGQFGAVWAAGLNPKYIWATAFGFAFSDFGYLAFFFFIFYGIISGYAYAEFGKNRIVFMILYPLIAVSVLKWWSILYISQRTTIICILLGILLSALSFIVKNIKIKRFHL